MEKILFRMAFKYFSRDKLNYIISQMRTVIILFIVNCTNLNHSIALSPEELEEKLIILAQKQEEYVRQDKIYTYDIEIKKNLESSTNGLLSTLVENGNRQDALSYDFPKLKKYFYIATSKDKKLRIYSIDVGGGSTRFYRKLVQYQGKNGKVYIIPYSEGDYGDRTTDDNSYCYDIVQIESKDGPIYLALSSLGPGKCQCEKIRLLQIKESELDLDSRLIKTETGLQKSISFCYDSDSLIDHPDRTLEGVSFDEQSKYFKIPIVINSDKYLYGEMTGDFMTYSFDGKYFVKLPGIINKDLSTKK